MSQVTVTQRHRRGPGHHLRPPRSAQRLRHRHVPRRHRRTSPGRQRSRHRGRGPDRARPGLHLGPGPGRDGRHRHRHRGRRGWPGLHEAARPVDHAERAPAGRRQRGGRRPGLHDAGPLRSGAGRRIGPDAGALRRARRPARSGLELPLPGPAGLATGRPHPADLGLGQRGRAGRAGTGPAGLRRRHHPDRDRGPGHPHRRPPAPSHPGHHVADAGRAARRCAGRQPARAGRVRPTARRRRGQAGPLAEFAAKVPT